MSLINGLGNAFGECRSRADQDHPVAERHVRFVEKRKFQRQLQVANQERALERERARIAQDLHDDLGSSLARISLLSNLARGDLQNPRELETHVAKIAQSSFK